jgi:mono/diheme cytochrome c family protein
LLTTEQVGQTWQGGVVTLPLEFRSGVMRGRINRSDGQLYVSGLKGWVSSAVDDGVLSRVRYTGQRFAFPSSVETHRNGLLIRFTDRVDPLIAGDADRYSASAWNYQYRAEYGSAEFHPRDPKREGREEWEISSATVLEDGRAVFLEIPSLIPVMQLVVEMKIESADHRPLATTLAYTIHEIPDRVIPEEQIVRRAKPGDLPREVEKRLERGMVFEVTADEREDVAFTRAWAWSVPRGTSLAEGISTGPFRARSAGYLKVPRAGEYRFAVVGTGRGSIQFNDQPVVSLDDFTASPKVSVHLHKGYNRFVFDYQSPVEGESRLRVLWESDSFPSEPIIATSLFFDATDPRVVVGKERFSGGGLVREHRCFHCHQGGDDLRRDAPDVIGIGSRISSDWLMDWLADPKRQRDQASMPALFDLSKEGDRQSLADVAAYLASLKSDDSMRELRPTPDERAGSSLYEGLNCFACHTLEEKDPLEGGRLSLATIQQKFSSSSLDEYLLDPSKHYRATPMPSFRLSLPEASQLRAFIFSATPPREKRKEGEGSIARGEKEFATRGCQQCHQVNESQTTSPAYVHSLPLDRWDDAGCLSESRKPGVPKFEFSVAERQAIANYWRSTLERKRSPALLVEAKHLMNRLNCHACHSRDGQSSPRLVIHQEESESGLPPEAIPDLTWASEKLREEYVHSLLAGEERSRARPWLSARMPTFAHAASSLATSWSAEIGMPGEGSKEHSKLVDADLVAIGEKLTGLSTGLDCRQCHAIGQQQPAGDDRTQLALGINFGLLKHRLRREHYLRFVLDPPRFDVSTRMPKLSLDGKTTKIRDVLEGDARRQFEAIWEFIQTVPDPKSP